LRRYHYDLKRPEETPAFLAASCIQLAQPGFAYSERKKQLTNALVAAVQSMQGDMQYLETISQNMANIATTGYKRAIPVADAFNVAMQRADPATAGQATSPATTLRSLIDLSTGPIKQTGKPLDIAITGEGYFELNTPDGPAFSRAGDFRLDNAGRLVSQAGFAVQGIGGDIVLNGPNATIDHAGHIVQGGETVAQIKIVKFPVNTILIKTAAGLLRPAENQNAEEVAPELQVGYLENSNVTPMREMVSMMETTRHFEAAQKLFQGYDDMLGTAIQKLGEF